MTGLIHHRIEQPLVDYLTSITRDAQRFGFGYRILDVDESVSVRSWSYEDWRTYWAERNETLITLDGLHTSIWSSVAYNVLLRHAHDWTHWYNGTNFTLIGELETYQLMLKKYPLNEFTPAFIENAERKMRGILYSEIVLHALHADLCGEHVKIPVIFKSTKDVKCPCSVDAPFEDFGK